MKHVVEGELYFQEMSYDQYDISTPFLITEDMDRNRIIYNNVGSRFINGAWEYDELEKRIISGLWVTEWLQEKTNLPTSKAESIHEYQPYKNDKFCSKSESTFQPQTKKVRITVEEIE